MLELSYILIQILKIALEGFKLKIRALVLNSQPLSETKPQNCTQKAADSHYTAQRMSRSDLLGPDLHLGITHRPLALERTSQA